MLGGFLRGGAIMDESHQGTSHAAGVCVLDDIATVHDATGTLPQNGVGALENFPIAHPAAATDEHRDVASHLNDLMIILRIIRGIGLDDVRTQLARLPDERHDLARSPST